MNNIKAYAYWDAVQNLRTGTIIVVNDDERVIGNVIMNERSALHFNKYAEDLRDSVTMTQDLLTWVLQLMKLIRGRFLP